jgi:hypothetical protein
MGADVVRVFPATSLGPGYIKDLRGPFPSIKLMPTGGVSQANAAEWIRAGAVAIGAGSRWLTPRRWRRASSRRSRRTRAFVDAVKGPLMAKTICLGEIMVSTSDNGWSAVRYDAATSTFLHSRRDSVRQVDRIGGGDSSLQA